MADRRMWIARMGVRNDWLDQVREDPIDPDREIVDPHHHLWNRNGSIYELDQLWSDTGAGHNVTQTVVIECRAGYREDGPEHLRPVGETEYVATIADASDADPERPRVLPQPRRRMSFWIAAAAGLSDTIVYASEPARALRPQR